MTERKSSKARDEGAPDSPEGVSVSAVTGGPAVPASHTIAPADTGLEDAQAGAVLGGTAVSSLPVSPEQIDRPDPLGRLDVPTSAPSGAPAGSTWGDPTVDRQDAQVNENEAGPRLAYVVTWGKAAIHVDAAQAKRRTVGEGENAREELYLTVQTQTGTRDVALEGQQITLERGDILPEESVPGQGVFLVSLGGALAVSI